MSSGLSKTVGGTTFILNGFVFEGDTLWQVTTCSPDPYEPDVTGLIAENSGGGSLEYLKKLRGS